MALQKPPLVSPSEMTLELPAARELWCAESAQAWRAVYLQFGSGQTEKGLSIAQSVSHISQIRHQDYLDRPLSAMIAVYCTCSAVWNQSQLNSIMNPPHQSASSFDALLGSNSWDGGLLKMLDQFPLVFSDWDNLFQAEISLVLQRILLSLHVSFDQVQLFAGKEGEDEARRAFPLLRHWSTTSDARKAVWHSGQILKAARRCPLKYLRDFQAVCLYHAGMTFWTYAVVSASSSDEKQTYHNRQLLQSTLNTASSDLVWLDGDDSPAVQRFIALNRGNPVVRDLNFGRGGTDGNSISLNNPKGIMDICIRLLRLNSPVTGEGTPLPLIENLSQLMHDLGNAAQELLQGGLKRTREFPTSTRHDR